MPAAATGGETVGDGAREEGSDDGTDGGCEGGCDEACDAGAAAAAGGSPRAARSVSLPGTLPGKPPAGAAPALGEAAEAARPGGQARASQVEAPACARWRAQTENRVPPSQGRGRPRASRTVVVHDRHRALHPVLANRLLDRAQNLRLERRELRGIELQLVDHLLRHVRDAVVLEIERELDGLGLAWTGDRRRGGTQ